MTSGSRGGRCRPPSTLRRCCCPTRPGRRRPVGAPARHRRAPLPPGPLVPRRRRRLAGATFLTTLVATVTAVLVLGQLRAARRQLDGARAVQKEAERPSRRQRAIELGRQIFPRPNTLDDVRPQRMRSADPAHQLEQVGEPGTFTSLRASRKCTSLTLPTQIGQTAKIDGCVGSQSFLLNEVRCRY